MASQTVSIQEFTCDACYTVKYAAPDGEMPQGYHGRVTEIHANGGTGAIEWYACRESHIKKAVLNAIDNS